MIVIEILLYVMDILTKDEVLRVKNVLVFVIIIINLLLIQNLKSIFQQQDDDNYTEGVYAIINKN